MGKARLVALAVACFVAIAALPAAASAHNWKNAPLISETLWLDTHDATKVWPAGPVSTSKALVPGALYLATIDGTYSIWKNEIWTAAPPCWPTPDTAPKYPSPGVTNGPVAVDAETMYGAPATSFWCGSAKPQHWNRLQVDVGEGFSHLEAIGGPFTTPTADHTYDYALNGIGDVAAFSFRLNDNPVTDNYGQLRIKVRAATALDCKKGGYAALGFKNQGQCIVSIIIPWLRFAKSQLPASFWNDLQS